MGQTIALRGLSCLRHSGPTRDQPGAWGLGEVEQPGPARRESLSTSDRGLDADRSEEVQFQLMGTSGTPSRWSVAVQLLREKGHMIGNAYSPPSGGVRIDIDHVPRTPRETIRLAHGYPEWPERERQYLEALRSYQRSLERAGSCPEGG